MRLEERCGDQLDKKTSVTSMRDVTSVLILDSRNMETGCSSKRKLAVEAAYSKSWEKKTNIYAE